MTTPPLPFPSVRHDERGIALALAIFALVIIATLVGGVFFMARLEQRSGSNTLWSTQASEAADAGLNATLANWSGGWNSMALGTPATQSTVVMGSNSRYTVSVMKLSSALFFVSSRGERTDGSGGILSGTSVGRVVRMVVPQVDINAAVTANGEVTLQGNLTVDGRDTDPPGWPACTTKDTVASVRTSQSIKAAGSYSAYGDPGPEGLVENDAGITSSIFTGPYDALKLLANVTHSGAWSASNSPYPSVSSGICNKSDVRNWGEPWRNPPNTGVVSACTGYFPIVWIRNPGVESRISGGRGQGVVLIEGDLDMSGGFEFNGLMIIMGNTKTTGTGAKITGALLAANEATGDITYIGGTPVVTYSSCAVATALQSSAKIRPVAERSWAQLY